MREIVAALIDERWIVNSAVEIKAAVSANRPVRFIDRQHMKFMAACDLGEPWCRLANGRTLFCIGDDGKPLPPDAAIRTDSTTA